MSGPFTTKLAIHSSFLSFINQVNNVLQKKCVWDDKEAGKRWQAEKQKKTAGILIYSWGYY